MFTVYAIASVNRKYIYVGFTADLEDRLNRHNSGYEKTTKPFAPFIIIHTETLPDRSAARNREKFLKSRSGKRFLYTIVTENFPQLNQYSS